MPFVGWTSHFVENERCRFWVGTQKFIFNKAKAKCKKCDNRIINSVINFKS